MRNWTPIDELANEMFAAMCKLDPAWAQSLGFANEFLDPDAFMDYSPEGIEQQESIYREYRQKFEALQPEDLADELTRASAIEHARQFEEIDFGLGDAYRNLNNLESPLQGIRSAFDLMPQKSPADLASVERRLANVPAAISGYIESLRLGKQKGLVPPQRQVKIGIAQASALAKSEGFFGHLAANPAAASLGDFGSRAKAARQAYSELSAFLKDELFESAPLEDAVGAERYAQYAKSFLGTELDLRETYEWGVGELERIITEQAVLARRIGATAADKSAAVWEAVGILDADPTLKLQGAQALQEWMSQVTNEALNFLAGSCFAIDSQLRRLECAIAPTNDGGIYYTGPSDDFERPGQMWWSIPQGVAEFSTWRERTTVYHEGVPGHHLQVGTATQNRGNLNNLRRVGIWIPGHGEGWALYAEKLMDDFGFLKTDADKLGMLDGQRLRATRIVIDIGVHCGFEVPKHLEAKYGSGIWNEPKAWQFLGDNVAMNEGFRRFELDRYLGWPGQAISYKVGQRAWENIRDEAINSGMDLKEFHSKALSFGCLGLDLLRKAVLG